MTFKGLSSGIYNSLGNIIKFWGFYYDLTIKLTGKYGSLA
jgi:hypothetical protein